MLVSEGAALIQSREDLLRSRGSGRAVADAVARRELIRVDRGWYARPEDWHAAYAEGRHLLRVIAAERRRSGDSPLVYSHCSAAVLWQLPLWKVEPRRVHVSGHQASGHVRASHPLVARHEVAVPDADVVERSGMRCTGLARTVADSLRVLATEAALALADAAMRQVAWADEARAYDAAAAECFRAEVDARLPSGGRGVRQARWILSLADGRAASPGESVSRLYLIDLGFRGIRLQTRVPAPSGWYYLDFDLEEAGAWGEYDGEGKYRDPELRGAALEDVILREKRREDWIRGTTNRKLPRWEKEHIASATTLARRLAEFHVVAPH